MSRYDSKRSPTTTSATCSAEEARITCAIVDAAAKVRDVNFKYLAEGNGATVTARFGPDGITICDPNRAGERAEKVFQKTCDKAIRAHLLVALRSGQPGESEGRAWLRALDPVEYCYKAGIEPLTDPAAPNKPHLP